MSVQVSFLEVVRELFLETFWYGDGVFLMDTEHFRRRLLSNIGNYTFQVRPCHRPPCVSVSVHA